MNEVELAALAAEVRYLRDRADILDCMNRYTRGADRLDRDLLLSAYHPDATDDRGAFTGGPEARVDWLLAYLTSLDHTSHHISNFTFDIDGDVAHCESYVITTLLPKGSDTVTIGGARYVDRFERRAGDWRIAHREAVMDFTFTADNNGIPPRAMQGLRGPADRSYARPLALTEEGRARMEAGLVAPAE
ncbi:MAG: nuclear transport factor 2 family protein [Novosphingobium sp.]|nr:nuclear transport factor 2 family protein [Novosphingobium sp.]